MIKLTDTVTPASIKKWAYKKTPQDPLPQLDELGTVVENAELLLTLVSDKNCPQRAHILNSLYTLVGRSVSKHSEADIGLINILLNKAAEYTALAITNWVTRSRLIMRDLRKYDYVEWCEGGFVHKDLAMIQ